MKKLVGICAALVTLYAAPARADYGATVSVNLSLGELREVDLGNGVKGKFHAATVTWTGGCGKGKPPTYDITLESTGSTPWTTGQLVATGLSFGGSHTVDVEPGKVYTAKGWINCSDSQGYEIKNGESQPVATAPVVDAVSPIMRTSPVEFFDCLPIGTEVKIVPAYQNTFGDGEQLLVEVSGAGISFARTFGSANELTEAEIKVTATSPGPAKLTMTKQPHGKKSAPLDVPVGTREACLQKPNNIPDPDDGDGDPEDDGKVTTQTESSGCSAAGGASPLLALALLAPVFALLRRRRA
ncbi:MAG: Synerg-CTERM sorting domain-containing protein [Myxococcales bacterium]